MLKKSVVIVVMFVASVFSHLAMSAEDEIYTSFFSDAGAGGYDVVAYFEASMPVKGSEEFTTEFKGAEWHFSSQSNLQTFLSDPDKYVPQYGGYCAYAVANNTTASGDPLQWTVLNGKLYLNYDSEIQSRWTENRDNFISLADKYWPGVLN